MSLTANTLDVVSHAIVSRGRRTDDQNSQKMSVDFTDAVLIVLTAIYSTVDDFAAICM